MLGWLARLIGGIWKLSRNSYVDVGGGLRPGSGAASLLLFLIIIFFLIGLVLVALGFDLNSVDLWLDAQSHWLDLAGRIVIKAMLALLLALCVFIAVGGGVKIGTRIYGRLVGLSDRKPAMDARRAAMRRYQGITRAGSYTAEELPPPAPPQEDDGSAVYWAFMILGAVVFGYFALVNLVGPL